MLQLLKTLQRVNEDPVRLSRRKFIGGLSIRKSPLHGFGCFATIRFANNSPIAEYAGERITRNEAMRRMRGPNGNCISELDANCYIDGCVEGNATQYINHSCQPNADAFIIDGSMIVFALREIVAGEEITVDYLNSFEEDRAVCQCRTVSCRQKINEKAA
jgi:SET domain-containing protein